MQLGDRAGWTRRGKTGAGCLLASPMLVSRNRGGEAPLQRTNATDRAPPSSPQKPTMNSRRIRCSARTGLARSIGIRQDRRDRIAPEFLPRFGDLARERSFRHCLSVCSEYLFEGLGGWSSPVHVSASSLVRVCLVMGSSTVVDTGPRGPHTRARLYRSRPERHGAAAGPPTGRARQTTPSRRGTAARA